MHALTFLFKHHKKHQLVAWQDVSGTCSPGTWTPASPFQSRLFISFATWWFLTELLPFACWGRCVNCVMATENRRNWGTGVCSRKLFFPREDQKVGRNVNLPSLPSSVPAAAPGWSFVAPSHPCTHCLQQKELQLRSPPNSLCSSALPGTSPTRLLPPGGAAPKAPRPAPTPAADGSGAAPRGCGAAGAERGPGLLSGGKWWGPPSLPRACPPSAPRARAAPGGKESPSES